jgi:hypothetical protein
MSGTRALTAERNGSKSARRSCAAVRRITTDASSVLRAAAPSPGKCFAVAATPPARYPCIAAATLSAIAVGPPAKARGRMSEPGPEGTSATGAKLTLMPSECRSFAAWPAIRRTRLAEPWAG